MILVVRPIDPEGHKEKLLLACILRRAAFDIALYRNHHNLQKRRLWIEAHNLMFTDDCRTIHPADRFTSFINVCSVLQQDPDWIRKMTMKLTRKDVKKYEMVDTHGRL